LADSLDFEADPVVATRQRIAALIKTHAVDLSSPDETHRIITSSPGARWFLDCEIIAIYW
jgi:hypothetical protein